MRKLFFILLIVPLLTKGQEAKIRFNIKNPRAKNIEIVIKDYTKADRLFEKEEEILVPLTDGKGIWAYKLSNPIFVATYYEDSVTKQYYRYLFYLSPGDNLDFSFDSNNPETTFAVKGEGSQNNQPLIQKLKEYINLDAHKKDTLPDNVFKAIKERATLNQNILKEYILKNHPTKEFQQIHSLYVQYFPVWTFLGFKGDQKFNVRQSYTRNETKWQLIEDSLINENSLNNTKILGIDEYGYFLSSHLGRMKERLWDHPQLLKDYYGTNTLAEALKLYNEDPENLLQEKIIEKNFTGKTAEFLYAVLFRDAMSNNEDNLPEIFSRFKKKYQQSRYIPYIEPTISAIEGRRKRKLTDKMVFVDNESYQTFDEVLKLIKGKTVLLDMWGTWCGPCRSEIFLNSDSIKNHFKYKALNYLYIANHDVGKESKWKELISYYNLTGIHILASNELTNDIMEKVKGEGFPTYVIIKKDGTFELSEAGYPMDRKILIDQLERALNY